MAKRILILFILGGVSIGPGDLSSCGPFFPEAVFTGKAQPLDEPRYFGGQLDILQPHYARIYLMVAYRYLTGIGVAKADQQALLAKPAVPDYFWGDPRSAAVQAWLEVRIQVGAPPFDTAGPNPINRIKVLPGNFGILNCGDDAFRNATATLTERGRAGASHDDLRAWVAAQDQVFSNCSEPEVWPPRPKPAEPSIPAVLPASAAPWKQADRVYQIAAAEFYAGQYDAACADFLRIAGDRSSPWHGIAPYLAARALIRKSTTVDPAAAPAAQEQLRKVLADPDAAAWHESARGLARYLLARTEPERVLSDLAHAVATEKNGVAGAMNDYRLMLDHYSNRGKEFPRGDDITDWIAAMQNGPADQALAKWRATRSAPWLVAALTYADRPDQELMAAAAKVAATSPAFPTVEFHRLRLLPPDEARPALDAALRRQMPVSARNLFLAARMRVSRDWDDLLRYAPRTVASNFEPGPWGVPAPPAGAASGDRPGAGREMHFDEDAARILDRQAPLALLRLCARNGRLPPDLQLHVARAAWVRSILLNDNGTASDMAKAMGSLSPPLKAYADGYLAAPDEKTRGFAAAWLLLNNPGMRVSIDSGAGRLTPTAKIDSYLGNWWCPANIARQPMNAPLELLYQGEPPEARFLTAAQRSEADQEQKRLAAAPAAPTFLARQTVEWIEAHPDDPRAPEALHLAVQAGHYSCRGDGDTDRWVKRAFQLLHTRYPKTAAARRTPYWFPAR
jgi:hypothetical protein